MNMLLPGAFMAADSPLHRLDPRVKMGGALLLMVLPFAAPGLWSSLFLVALLAALALISAAPVPALLRTLRTVFWLGFIMFFFYLFTTPGRTVVVLGGVQVTWEGVLAGVVQIYRLSFLVILSALLTFTTSPSQLAHGLETVLEPLALLGLPVRDLALVLTIALRFVPTLFDEIEKIIQAQRARGVDFGTRNPWRRVWNWVPVFVPVFVSAFRRADDLAMAMEARGFRDARHRTRLYRLRLTWSDLVALLLALAVGLVALGLERLV